jgi:hypothetical protein
MINPLSKAAQQLRLRNCMRERKRNDIIEHTGNSGGGAGMPANLFAWR